MGESFHLVFPELLEGARELYRTMSMMSMIVLFAGLLLAAWRGSFGSLDETMRGILSVGVITVVIQVFPDWVDQLQQMFHALVQQLKADPSESHAKFAKLITGETDQDLGFWDVLFDDDGGFGKAMIYAAILLVGKVAWLVMWMAYWIQHMLLIYGIALAPISLSMFMLNATRGIAIRYLLSLLGIIIWPLGWAVADVATTALLKLAATDKIYVVTSTDALVFGTQTLFFILLLSIWILVSTIAAPRLVSQAIQTGSQIGVSLMSTMGTSMARGASYGAGAGLTMSMGGSSAGAIAAGVGGGAVGGIASGATGGGGVIGPTLIGAMAMTAGGGGGSSKDVNQEAAQIAAKHRT